MTDQNKNSELLALLAERAEALRTSEGWLAWLETAARFHAYTFRNQLLILAQRPDATRVAGYRTWQSLGRQVMKGERGISILAPCVRKVDDDPTGTRTVVTGFRAVRVFDIAQTSGDPLPEPEFPDVAGCPDSLYDRLLEVAATNGWQVTTVESSANGARGWWETRPGRITIVDGYDLASRTRTLLHELSHAFDYTLPGGNDAGDRAERELIAESSAYLIGSALGVGLVDSSVFYVASWGGNTEALTKIAERVLKVAEALTNSINATQRDEAVAA